ncbi:hypothetical protein GWK47_032522 [Chionoecetes opilio]|uniref:Endonuclease/exonuclease/phosphatase domain-containing protein n=1 Tax=Chionoecetes opilio TaxID=41210 RepID=A0A8J4YW19_CHIOP|nr:hypothetical protein GWK47_032522 [Chionoecetes opilio]
MVVYVKRSIPVELVSPPGKHGGIECIAVKLRLAAGCLTLVNVYVSQNSLRFEHLPDSVFRDPTLLVGDLNARHDSLGSAGSRNWNGTVWHQFLNDYDDVRLLGDDSPTHLQGGRIDYACLFNTEGMGGKCEVVSELLSDHFALYVELPLGKALANHGRVRYTITTNNRIRFVNQLTAWYSRYRPHDVDTFYEDLVKQIFTVVDKNTAERKSTPVRRNYTKDVQVRAWNTTVRRAHQEWTRSGKTDEARIALQEVAKACSVVREEARVKY